MHKSSVLDDPTRVIRASRYSAKLDFDLSNQALKQIKDTINLWPWNWHIGDNTDLAPSALSIRLKNGTRIAFRRQILEECIKKIYKSVEG